MMCRVSAQSYSKVLCIGARVEAVCEMGSVGASAASNGLSVEKRRMAAVAMHLSAVLERQSGARWVYTQAQAGVPLESKVCADILRPLTDVETVNTSDRYCGEDREAVTTA